MKPLKYLGFAFPVFLLILVALLGLTLLRYYEAVEQWQAESARLEMQAESDYYRGVLSACVGIGMQSRAPSAMVATRCTTLMHNAYEADWFTELEIDSWQWPPKKE